MLKNENLILHIKGTITNSVGKEVTVGTKITMDDFVDYLDNGFFRGMQQLLTDEFNGIATWVDITEYHYTVEV